MAKYRFLEPVQRNGEKIPAGAVVDLADEEVTPLLDRGWIVPALASLPVTAQWPTTATAPESPPSDTPFFADKFGLLPEEDQDPSTDFLEVVDGQVKLIDASPSRRPDQATASQQANSAHAKRSAKKTASEA